MILLEKEFTLDDIEIGDMVRLRPSGNLPYWVNKQSQKGHWYFVLSKEPLIVCISTSNPDKLKDKFPWNIKYHDRKDVVVKTDTPIKIKLNNIKSKLDFDKNRNDVTKVLNRYNDYVLYRKNKEE